MGANKKFSVILSIFIAVFIVISLSGCFSEWHGGDANLTIYLGGGANRDVFYPDDNTLAQLRYVIEFSGPSTFKVGPTKSGEGKVSVSLFPGKWDITVTAYNKDDSVYAIGKATVEARAGQNVSKIITLNLEWKVFTSIVDFWNWLINQPENRPTSPYHAKLNVSNLVEADTSLGFVLRTEGNSNKYVKLDLSGSTFQTIDTGVINECTNLVSIIIPNSVITIGSMAFSDCTSLTSITIPGSVTKIEDKAFSGCTNLTSVTFATGSNISNDNFGINAFPDKTNGGGGDSLKTAYKDSANPKAGTYMREPNGLTWSKAVVLNRILDFETWIQEADPNDITAPYNVKLNVSDLGGGTSTSPNSVGGLLHGNIYNKYINLDLSGSTIKTIPFQAFNYCPGLTGITIPNSVTSIGEQAFQTCSNLKRVSFIANSKVTTIGSHAFSGCALIDIAIPNSVKTIGNNAFADCIQLTTVTFAAGSNIPDNNFGSNAFPEGALGSGGNSLRTAYSAGKAGTYTRATGSETWAKQ